MKDISTLRQPVETIKDLYSYVHGLKDEITISHTKICSELKRLFIELSSIDRNIVVKDLEYLINLYSEVDHLFFKNILSRIATEEEHALYSSAISNFGQYLSLLFQESYGKNKTLLPSNSSIANVLFIIKGPFEIGRAHV